MSDSIGPIQVSLSGPGSQPIEAEDARLEYIALPKEMDTYRAPEVPDPERVTHLTGARAAMSWLREALSAYRVGGPARVADLSGLDAANRELVNQVLSEGEVSLRYDGAFQARMQESVLAGIWRTLYLDARGRIRRDSLEVADAPVLARRAHEPEAALSADLSRLTVPDGIMNALPILSELGEHLAEYRAGGPAHVVNLTLLPLAEADLDFLDRTLGRGTVQTLSRGYGDCQILSTAYTGLWWVRYYNSMGTLILNTLEVVDIPRVTCAAQEDLDDSRERLRELLEPYWRELE